MNLAERLSKGQLDQEFRLGGRDELTQLGEAMASVRQSVQAAIGAQLQMAEQHEAGAIRYRMDASAFPAISAAWCRPPTAWSNRTCRWNC